MTPVTLRDPGPGYVSSMPPDRQQYPGVPPADPAPRAGRRRFRHLDDAVLDQLLEPDPDPALVGDVTLHAAECQACRNTLEEWTTLFPHLDVVLPRIPRAQATRGLQPPAPRVVIPDNEPPRRPRQSHRLAWGLVALLLVAVGVLAWQLFLRSEPVPVTPVAAVPPVQTPVTSAPPADSALDSTGPVVLTSPAVVVSPRPPTDTATPPVTRGQEQGLASGVTGTRDARPAAPAPAPTQVEREPEPEPPPAARPATFPRNAPAEARPAGSGARETSPSEPANLVPTFRRIELGDAIEALGGTIRTLSGLTPEEVYLAPGRIVPGARGDKPLVRLAYRTASGERILLDQQHLGPAAASREASIAASTTASGVTVAQWIDRDGFWISLAGHMDQEELLRYANQLQ